MATGQITWQDVQQAPEDGKRREAIAGDLYVTAAPNVRHQRVSLALTVALYRILVEGRHGELMVAPVGVEFPETGEGVQPDLLFVSNDRRGIIADDWLRGPPDLVVEIVSPSTEERDWGVKRKLYRRQGVREYWIVDPEEEAVEVWRFRGDAGEDSATSAHRRLTDRLPVRAAGEVVGEIELEAVFRRV
jgi:Uma2 family endonuclease